MKRPNMSGIVKEYGIYVLLIAVAVAVAALVFGRSVRCEFTVRQPVTSVQSGETAR